jgi:regulatory protein YycH of two-component signal transduction system YycFG
VIGMTQSVFTSPGAVAVNIKRIVVLLLLAGIVALPGCGSTKVYTNDKTLVYRGELYNLSNVQRLGSRVEGKLPNGDKVNMKQMDKKEINRLLDEHESFVVTSYVEMDDKEMVFQNSRVDSYSDVSKMTKNIDSAMSKIQKFMANKKSTQLKLK